MAFGFCILAVVVGVGVYGEFLRRILRVFGCEKARYMDGVKISGGLALLMGVLAYVGWFLGYDTGLIFGLAVAMVGCSWGLFRFLVNKFCEQEVSFVGFVASMIAGAVVFGVVGVVIRGFIAAPFYVSGESMLPSFWEGEYVWVDKLDRDFERGDVVVFASKLGGGDGYMIKRIVGLPGETIELRGGWVYVCDGNGCEKLDEGEYLEDKYEGYTCGIGRGCADVEYNIPWSAYFVLGDNRADSMDSRFFELEGADFFVRENDIEGKAK